MSLPLTKPNLAAAYEYLRACPPFKAWGLPHAEHVVFKINKDPTRLGTYQLLRDRRVITISKACVGQTNSLLMAMAHEILHFHQCVAKLETRSATHNAHFNRTAARICRIHGWDPKLF